MPPQWWVLTVTVYLRSARAGVPSLELLVLMASKYDYCRWLFGMVYWFTVLIFDSKLLFWGVGGWSNLKRPREDGDIISNRCLKWVESTASIRCSRNTMWGLPMHMYMCMYKDGGRHRIWNWNFLAKSASSKIEKNSVHRINLPGT